MSREAVAHEDEVSDYEHPDVRTVKTTKLPTIWDASLPADATIRSLAALPIEDWKTSVTSVGGHLNALSAYGGWHGSVLPQRPQQCRRRR